MFGVVVTSNLGLNHEISLHTHAQNSSKYINRVLSFHLTQQTFDRNERSCATNTSPSKEREMT